eukprot:17550-Heterococcus_DN1.PRE.1
MYTHACCYCRPKRANDEASQQRRFGGEITNQILDGTPTAAATGGGSRTSSNTRSGSRSSIAARTRNASPMLAGHNSSSDTLLCSSMLPVSSLLLRMSTAAMSAPAALAAAGVLEQ